jgi:hydrogenase maturation protein HypF
MISGMVRDLCGRTDPGVISRKFHCTVIRFLTEAVFRVFQDTGIDRIALSGGSFQNAILLEGMTQSLIQKRMRVYTHSLVPANDGGLALGQAVIAAQRIHREDSQEKGL